MVQTPSSSYTLKYDAWNRLVEVKDGAVVQANEYDGLNRRIVKTVGADTYDYYYNRQWQVIEIRKNGDIDPEKQYFYHPYYVDAVAVRYYDENTDGSDIVSHYYLQDANFNVTAVTDSAGTVVERYAYTPYGEVSFLASDFSPLTSSLISNEYLYTGRRRDPETGLQLNRLRIYESIIGRWLTRDPVEYEGSRWNLYEYVEAKPLDKLDPSGLAPVLVPPVNAGNIPSHPDCGRSYLIALCTKVGQQWHFKSVGCPCLKWCYKKMWKNPRVMCPPGDPNGYTYLRYPCLGKNTTIGVYECKLVFGQMGGAVIPRLQWRLIGGVPGPCK